MCTYITETAAILGTAKGQTGWINVDTANVYYDHPQAAPLDHTLNIDFVNPDAGIGERVSVELTLESARALADALLAALERAEAYEAQ